MQRELGVILAAGRGSRLKELSLEQPKPMIQVNEVTIISNLIRTLIHSGIRHIVVIIGYKAERLREHLAPFSDQVQLTFVENKDYETTNNIYSLWLAKDHLTKGFSLFEADVFIEENIVRDFLDSRYEDLMLVDKFQSFMNGTVVDFDQSYRVKRMYMKRDQEADTFSYDDKYKTVNFYKISEGLSQSFFLPKLDQHIASKDTGSYYELIIKEAVDSGLPFYVFETGDRKWFEIDTQEDLNQAQQLFS